MIASVTGINFYNKGAELMAYAVSREFSAWGEDHRPSAHLGIGTFADRRAAGLDTHLWITNRQRDKLPGAAALLAGAGNALPTKFLGRRGMVSDREVDVILDASGFAFSDQWGPGKAEKMAMLCHRWRASGKRIILLPQAFGPFRNLRTRDATAAILQNSDLVFARDERSFDELIGIHADPAKVRLAPDFTNLLEALPRQDATYLAGRSCVIPNTRMIDKTADGTSDAYLEFLVQVISGLVDRDEKPFLLIHEKTDRPLADQLRALVVERLTIDLDVVSRSSALELKAIIGSCRLVIGSRFHGLVSALSQAVPCIATGWSHKYTELFRDYGIEDHVVPVTPTAEEALALLTRYQSPEVYVSVRNQLFDTASTQKDAARAMWSEVRAALS